jgi:hypothetical protein
MPFLLNSIAAAGQTGGIGPVISLQFCFLFGMGTIISLVLCIQVLTAAQGAAKGTNRRTDCCSFTRVTTDGSTNQAQQ